MTQLASPASPLSVGSVAQLTFSLIAIVALIFVIGWVLKRFRLAGPRGRGGIAVLDELSLSPRERIVLVRVGDAQLLVGVGASGLTSLTPLATPILIAGAEPAPPFADRLRDLMKRPGGVE